MKIAKIILLALTTCLTSCYEDYTHDYETTNVGFALQNPLRTVISDRDMPIYVGVSLGGKREVDMNDWAKFTLDASLLEGTPLTLLPEEYYILEDPEIFKVRKSNLPVADVEIKFTDAFYTDPLSLTTHYALPFKVTESSMNTIREGADYSREYSTLGGISLYCTRFTSLLCSSSSRLLESMTLEIPVRRLCNSLKRMVSCWFSSQMIRSFHFPFSNPKAYFTGHSSIIIPLYLVFA